ncbi:MAG: hypothetical protein R6V56_05035 [Lentisphaeria bacterium]
MDISKFDFMGADAVHIKTSAMQLVVVTEFGPRIAFLGKPDGNNLFLWEPGKHKRGDWDLRGGHRVWVTTPQADESEDAYGPDNDPCDVEMTDKGVRVIGAENTANGTRRGMEITVLDDNTVKVDNFVMNTGELLYSGGVWALTCSLPKENTQYAVPIGDGSSWDTFTSISFREWAGHQGGFADPQFTIDGDLYKLHPQGKENKRMLQSHRGIAAMSNPVDKVTFAKKVDYNSAGKYPLNTNIALYVGPDNFMVEMETMGPERTIKPGEELHHVETWKLRDEVVALDTGDDVEAIFA